jgi:hypothetical protein
LDFKKEELFPDRNRKASEIPLYFDMPSSYTVDDIRAKSLVSETSGYEKMCVTLMLAEFANGTKSSPYVILNHKAILKEQLLRGIIVRCQPKC